MFYGTEDPTLHNVDAMTDVSMAGTEFTRYTVAPTAVSRTSTKLVVGIQQCVDGLPEDPILDEARGRSGSWREK